MNTILLPTQAIEQATKLHKTGKQLVLAGGCFDVLHIGHLTFLEKAKAAGDILFVLVESDAFIAKTKGNMRPINTQHDRARLLASLRVVDYVVCLPEVMTDASYDDLVIGIKPAIIATTAGDPNRQHKVRQSLHIGATVSDVASQVKNKSTTQLVKVIHNI